MIAKLTGLVDTSEVLSSDSGVIVDVQGVGYEVFCSSSTLSNLPPDGERVSLFIDMIVREDSQTLYGFYSKAEKFWFRTLCSVQGVGAKAALSILSVLSAEALLQAISSQDKTMLTRADGIGPKIAGRIVNELKDKVATEAMIRSTYPSDGVTAIKSQSMGSGNVHSSLSEDAISALMNLGYRRAEVFSVVQKMIADNQEQNLETLITNSLKELSA